MKKIMFSHKWGLHQAAITGEKPTTLRIIPKRIIEACKDPANPFDYPNREKLIQAAPYHVGDVVAIAEPYKDIFSPLDWANREIYRNEYGWDNKMYVQATLMNHFALIKEVTAREAQTLTYEELLEDGLEAFRQQLLKYSRLAGQIRAGHLVQEFFYQTMKIDIRKESPLVYRYRYDILHRGTCRVCGCTDGHACTNPTHGNCWWVDDTETLCSHCALPEIADDPFTFHPNPDRPC